jgi:hypothetical protein
MAKKDPKRVIIYGDLDEGDLGKSLPGKRRHWVTCYALHNGESVEIQHPWRAFTHEEAIASVKAHHRGAYGKLTNCRAVEIPGSLKKP